MPPIGLESSDEAVVTARRELGEWAVSNARPETATVWELETIGFDEPAVIIGPNNSEWEEIVSGGGERRAFIPQPFPFFGFGFGLFLPVADVFDDVLRRERERERERAERERRWEELRLQIQLHDREMEIEAARQWRERVEQLRVVRDAIRQRIEMREKKFKDRGGPPHHHTFTAAADGTTGAGSGAGSLVCPRSAAPNRQIASGAHAASYSAAACAYRNR